MVNRRQAGSKSDPKAPPQYGRIFAYFFLYRALLYYYAFNYVIYARLSTGKEQTASGRVSYSKIPCREKLAYRSTGALENCG